MSLGKLTLYRRFIYSQHSFKMSEINNPEDLNPHHQSYGDLKSFFLFIWTVQALWLLPSFIARYNVHTFYYITWYVISCYGLILHIYVILCVYIELAQQKIFFFSFVHWNTGVCQKYVIFKQCESQAVFSLYGNSI